MLLAALAMTGSWTGNGERGAGSGKDSHFEYSAPQACNDEILDCFVPRNDSGSVGKGLDPFSMNRDSIHRRRVFDHMTVLFSLIYNISSYLKLTIGHSENAVNL